MDQVLAASAKLAEAQTQRQVCPALNAEYLLLLPADLHRTIRQSCALARATVMLLLSCSSLRQQARNKLAVRSC